MRDPKLNPGSGDVLQVRTVSGALRTWIPIALGQTRNVTWVSLPATVRTRMSAEQRLLVRGGGPDGTATLQTWRRLVAEAEVLETNLEPMAVWTDEGIRFTDPEEASP